MNSSGAPNAQQAILDPADIQRQFGSGDALTIGLVEAPKAGIFFVGKDPENGQPFGITAALGRELARSMGRVAEYRLYPNSGECTDALSSGAIPVAFMPVDDERRKRVAFGPGYYLLESTYLVTRTSGLTSLADIDSEGVRVIGIANTTTIRASARTLSKTQPQAVRSVGEALQLLQRDQVDAFALSRDSLPSIASEVPGSFIVDGGFQHTRIAIAVPQGRSAALDHVTTFLEGAKSSGLLRQIFDEAGFVHEAIAPPGT